MNANLNKAIVSEFLATLANSPTLEAMKDCIEPNATCDYLSSMLAARVMRAFPDIHIDPQELIAAGDVVICRSNWTATHQHAFFGIPPTGSRITGNVLDVFRVELGKIVEVHQKWNILSIVRALRETRAEPVLDVHDIQGNILAGFNKDHQGFVFCQILDPKLARQWLARLVPHIATLDEVLRFNNLFKSTRERRNLEEGTVRATWINIAFAHCGLVRLFPDALDLNDRAFSQGMASRWLLLGADDPAHWLVGGPQSEADVVMIVASDDRQSVEDAIQRIEIEAGDGLRIICRQSCATLPQPQSGHEPFGFADGISQPGIRGRVSGRHDDFLTPRQNSANLDQGKPGQDLLSPFEFILGPEVAKDSIPDSHASPVPSWAKNGSFLVIQRYRQDPQGFQDFLDFASRSLAASHPELQDCDAEKLGAMLLGRWRSGAPLMRTPNRDSPLLGDDPCANNNFVFVEPSQPLIGASGRCDDSRYPSSRGDADGLRCPFSAHIRRANPRDDLHVGTVDVNKHRILRRGIPFTDATTGEQGLMFACYQASIERQFEYIVRNWLNHDNIQGESAGWDPIVGRAHPTAARIFKIRFRDLTGGISTIPLQLPTPWVTPTGGGYFFSPSLTTLKLLSQQQCGS
jgi:Dyp-type peroxidase family